MTSGPAFGLAMTEIVLDKTLAGEAQVNDDVSWHCTMVPAARVALTKVSLLVPVAVPLAVH